MKQKKRLDQLLLDKGYYESREKAKRAIMAGQILVDDKVIDKPGTKVFITSHLRNKGSSIPYVGRGGFKLEKVVQEFGITLKDKVFLDVGASTGGFTDCALQNGAEKVYAVDTGYNQLAWKLRQDSRVICMENTNARYLCGDNIDEKVDLISIDVSFISLEKIFPAVVPLLKADGELIALVKPQFEAGKEKVAKKGIVKDRDVHKEVLLKIISNIELIPYGITYSPIKGRNGNIEYLIYFKKEENTSFCFLDSILESIIDKAHREL